MRLLALLAVLVAAAPILDARVSAAHAADVPSPTGSTTQPSVVMRGAVTGIHQRIAFLYQENAGCTPEGVPTVHTLSPPQHGKLEATKDDKYPWFAAGSQMVECNLHPVSGVVLYYTSAAGFQGEDTATVSVIYPDGLRYVIRYQITVESAG